MSTQDDWPTNSDGTDYDGERLLELARKNENPFKAAWDVDQLIQEVEEKLKTQVVDIPLVSKGSNNYGIHMRLQDRPDIVVRMARGDVNMPDYDGFPLEVQVPEVRFEAAVYELLSGNEDIKASKLVHHRVPVRHPPPLSAPPKDLAGRRFMIFERAEGENNVWYELNAQQQTSLLMQTADIRAALFNFNLPLGFATEWLRERLFETKPASIPVPIAPTREFCLSLFTSKIEATIKNEGELIGWEDDGNIVGPLAAAAKQSILHLIPLMLPEETSPHPMFYRLVLEHGDFGIHNMSIVQGEADPEITSLYDWETGCIVPALLSDTMMAVHVDLDIGEDGAPTIRRVWEEASAEDIDESMKFSRYYHEELFERVPDYEHAIKAGNDARHLWFALRDWRGEESEEYFGRLGAWAEGRLRVYE